MSSEYQVRWNPHALVLGLITAFYLIAYGIGIRLIYHLQAEMTFGTVLFASLPIITLWSALYMIARVSWIKLHKQHLWFTASIGVILLFFSLYALSQTQSKHRFDYNRWVGYPEQRALMVESMLKEHDLIGLTQAEIMDALGANDNAMWNVNETNQVVYNLGAGKEDGRNEWLFINFDDHGFVQSIEILTRPPIPRT